MRRTIQAIFILCITLVCGSARTAQAQTPTRSSALTTAVANALAKQVHLSADLTVRQAFQSLSEQTGVPIQLADALGERHLMVQLDHVTAKDALDAIAELEEWQWKEDTAGRIVVERRPTLVPKELAFIPRLIQAELPRDIRDYFGITRPSDDPKTYYWSMMGNEYFPLLKRLQNSRRLQIEEQRLVVEGHRQALEAGEKVYFSALSPKEQEALVLALTVRTISRTGAGFWKGDLPPYVQYPRSATLEVKNEDNLLIGTYMQAINPIKQIGVPADDNPRADLNLYDLSMLFGGRVKR